MGTMSPVAVAGLGVMGTSIAQALRRSGLSVVGHDLDPRVARRARALDAIDERADTLAGLAGAAIGIVAVPPDMVVPIARRLLEYGIPTVTDIASSHKASIVPAVGHPRFVGGHPMAGSEREGPDAARSDLLDGAEWILTPTPATDSTAVEAVTSLVRRTGARPVYLSPERHDELVAVISHVPHVAATAVALLAGRQADAEAAIALAGGGYRGVTRVAMGSPALWTQILSGNPVLAARLRELSGILSELATVVADDNRPALHALLEAGQQAARRAVPPARAA